jgi:hypothetical protein
MTATVFTGLYTLALLSQMYVISIYLPTRIAEAAGQQDLQGFRDPGRVGHRLQLYLNRNRFVVLVGLVPILVAWFSDFENSLTLVLLMTGLCFFVQVATLIGDRNVRNLLSAGGGLPQRVSRPLVVGAAVAYVGYVVASVLHQNEALATQWAKIRIVTLANLVIVLTVASNLLSARRGSAQRSRVPWEEFGRSINVLAAISIGLSVYFLGKDVLADLDLAGLRPLTMSVFLQGLMLLTVRAQLTTSAGSTIEAESPGDNPS